MTSTPLPEQGGFNERLDSALALIKYSVEYRETHGGCPPEVSAIKRHGITEAKSAIRTLVLEEIIGEDADPDDASTDRAMMHMIGGNIVRSYQRKKVEDTNG